MNNHKHMVDITLALPVFNEELNIEKVIHDSIIALDVIGRTWEIIIVDNCQQAFPIPVRTGL